MQGAWRVAHGHVDRRLSAEKCADLDAKRSQSSRRLGHPVGVAVAPGAQALDQCPSFLGLRRWPWGQPRGAIETFTRVNSHSASVAVPCSKNRINLHVKSHVLQACFLSWLTRGAAGISPPCFGWELSSQALSCRGLLTHGPISAAKQSCFKRVEFTGGKRP